MTADHGACTKPLGGLGQIVGGMRALGNGNVSPWLACGSLVPGDSLIRKRIVRMAEVIVETEETILVRSSEKARKDRGPAIWKRARSWLGDVRQRGSLRVGEKHVGRKS